MVVCKFYLEGRCMKGESCRFTHEAEPHAPPTQQRQTAGLSESGRLNPTALAWTAQPTLRPALTREMMGAAIDSPPPPSIPKIPCRFFQQGACRNGAACTFVHDGSARTEDFEAPDENGPEIDDYKRDIGATAVQFGSGAVVSKVSMTDDYSAVRITGLAANSAPFSVAEILLSVGQKVGQECIRVGRDRESEKTVADILVEDPNFATSICQPSNLDRLSSQGLLNVRKVTPSIAGSSSSRRVERRKVQCSWFKPVKRAWLNFGSAQVAQRVYDEFNRCSYTLNGRRVKCAEPQDGNIRTVMLIDLPLDVTSHQIKSSIKSGRDQPDDISLGQAAYNVDGEEACATVFSLLIGFGAIEWSQANTELEGKRAKAVARYCDEADAMAAERQLHGKKLPFAQNLKLDVQLLSTAKFKVRTKIFKIVQLEIRAASAEWSKQGTAFKAYPPSEPTSQYRIIRLEGQTTANVAAAKNELDRILEGTTILDNEGHAIWHPSLQSRGPLTARIKALEMETGVIIICDRRQKRLQVIGPKDKFTKIKLTLLDELSHLSSKDSTITLDAEAFRWACRGGFRTLSASLGPDIAAFDITAKTITIRGSDQDFEKALRMVRARQLIVSPGQTEVDDICPVCFTEAEQPVRLACGDTYCADCFEALCAAAGAGNITFPLLCPGQEGRCQKVLTLQELQDNLPSSAFEDMLEASFTSHIQKHTQDYAYCSGPDCDAIYRKNARIKIHTCAKCFTVTCTSCYAQHDGETCAEYYDRTSGASEATARVKRELGIKDCPKCETAIEKIDGCNHVTCRGCSTHICWKCLAHFSSGGLCYEHMNEAHGGIYEGGVYDQ